MSAFSNELSASELERLAILSEEMGEAQQCIGKILRHGYESWNPVVDTGMTNRRELERECGDICEAIAMLMRAKDINEAGVYARQSEKRQKIKRYLHHQVRKDSADAMPVAEPIQETRDAATQKEFTHHDPPRR